MLGVGGNSSEHLIRAATGLTAALGRHLVCAFVDPASYLTEWEPDGLRTARSLDPVVNDEADFPSRQLQRNLESILGQPGDSWSFRVLNGDVAKALNRLAENANASLLVVGAVRPGLLAAKSGGTWAYYSVVPGALKRAAATITSLKVGSLRRGLGWSFGIRRPRKFRWLRRWCA